jgi:hypothetical protein
VSAAVTPAERKVLYHCHLHNGFITPEHAQKRTFERMVQRGHLEAFGRGFRVTDAGKAAYPFVRPA